MQIILLITIGFTLPLAAQEMTADRLERALMNTQSTTNKLDIMVSLMEVYEASDLSKALMQAKKGSALATSQSLPNYIVLFDTKMGELYTSLTKYDSAHFYFNAAIHYYEQQDNKQKIAELLRAKAFTYQNQGQYTNTTSSIMKALTLCETIEDQKGVAHAYMDLANVMYYMERPDKGIDYGLKAIPILQEIKDEEGLTEAYQITSHNYLGNNEHLKALELINKALPIKKRISTDLLEIGSLMNAKGNVLKFLEKHEEAIEAYQESNRIATQFNHLGGISATLANIGDVYIRMGKYQEALPIMLKGARIQEENGFVSNLMENVNHLSNIYKNLGDFENALLYKEKYVTIRDSMISLEKDGVVSELETKYQTEKKEAIISTQEQRITQQRTIQWFTFGCMVLLGIVLFQLFFNYRQKLKSNELLTNKNEENELLLKEIHHRVKNNLQIITSLLRLQSANINDPNALEAVKESQSRVRSMALIHQKLYQGKSLAAVEMKDYFETMSKAVVNSYGKKASDISLDIQMEEIELDVETAIPIGLIVNELLTNSLKYAFPNNRKGKIEISLIPGNQKEICLRVADNGVGLNADKTAETTTGTGFGGQLIQLLTTQLGGQLNQQSQKGTVVSIKFSPVIKTA